MGPAIDYRPHTMIKPTSHLARDRGAAQAQRAGCGGGERTTTITRSAGPAPNAQLLTPLA